MQVDRTLATCMTLVLLSVLAVACGGSGGGSNDNLGNTLCTNTLASVMVAPAKLSETGLYADISGKTIAAKVARYTPQYPEWGDGAVISRYAYLPECEEIDNSSEDEWQFPVGTRMWQEFVFNGVLVETRMIHRFGTGANDFLYAAYQWDNLDADATLTTAGSLDVRGQTWDIPNSGDCVACHGENPGQGGTDSRILGFSALQLSHAMDGITMATLSNEGKLAIPNAVGYTLPGSPVEQSALGYLHGNCGNCHNDSGSGLAFPAIDMRVNVSDTMTAQTGAYTTLVNLMATTALTCTQLIHGGDTADSCVIERMNQRGTDTVPNMVQMPPIASDVVDGVAVGLITTWIATLPP